MATNSSQTPQRRPRGQSLERERTPEHALRIASPPRLHNQARRVILPYLDIRPIGAADSSKIAVQRPDWLASVAGCTGASTQTCYHHRCFARRVDVRWRAETDATTC